MHRIFCDHLNALALQQLPADSLSAWKMHVSACIHAGIESSLAADWVSIHSSGNKNFAGRRSLKKLFGLTNLDLKFDKYTSYITHKPATDKDITSLQNLHCKYFL